MSPGASPLPILLAMAVLAAPLLITGCGGPSGAGAGPGAASGIGASGDNGGPGDPATHGPAVERDVERIRAATARFQSLDEAVAAGYPRTVAHCLANPPHGAMGYHHVHPQLMNEPLDMERPEILVYERTEDGGYELVGVEYAAPLSAWPRDEPPTILGQALKPAPELGIWYLHVWVWRTNPNGLFADWNPEVECRNG